MFPSATHSFTGISLDDLASMSSAALDELPFGVIAFTPDTIVTLYNATEARYAGIPADTVIGEPYFSNVAQCMNNFLVAQRFEDEPELDVTLSYVLTLRMRPTPVTLRLLKRPSVSTCFLLVQR